MPTQHNVCIAILSIAANISVKILYFGLEGKGEILTESVLKF